MKADAIARGDALMAGKKHHDAVLAYLPAVEIDPKDGPLRLKLARAHQAAHQWEDASRQFITAAELMPGDRELQLESVRAMLGMSRFSDAAHRASALLSAAPDDPEVLVLLGTAIVRQTFYDTGVGGLESALRGGDTVDAARKRLRPRLPAAEVRAAEDVFRKAYALAPERFDTLLGLASFLWIAGDADEGAALLKVGADRDPGYGPISRALGVFYESRGRHDEAERYLRAAARTGDRESALALAEFLTRRNALADALQALGPHLTQDADGRASLRAADIHYRRGDHALASRHADAVLAREPANAQALRIKANVLLTAREFAGAAKSAAAAVTADPWSPDAHATLGRARAALGELPSAFDELTQAWRLASDPQIARELAAIALRLGRDRDAVEYARHALAAQRNDAEMQLTLVRGLVGIGEFAAADQAIAPLVASGAPTADLLLLQARIHIGRERPDVARTTFLRVLQSDPDMFEALSGLVAVEIENRNAARIRPRVDQAALRHAGDPAYQLLAARVAAAVGDSSAAESRSRAILAIDRAHEEAAVMLADALVAQHRDTDALRELEGALEARPASLPIQLSLATRLESLGRRPEARARYERLLTEHPRAATAAFRLATLYADQGERLDRALELASMAKQAMPGDPAVSDALGWVYVRRGLAESAVPHLEDAVRGVPGNARYRYHLGTAYFNAGARREARAELTRALELDPHAEFAQEARALLSTIGR